MNLIASRLSLPLLLVTFATAALVSCKQRSPTGSTLRAVAFDLISDGQNVHLVTALPGAAEKSVELFYHRRTDSGFSSPTIIPTSHAPAGNHHRGNDPQIAASGNRLMALWTAKGAGPYGSGPLATALSDDGGITWQAGPSPTPAADGKREVGYRFPAIAASDDAFHVVWIHAEGEERSLRYSKLSFSAKTWTEPVIIDEACCACCWNELKVDASGTLYVLYRDEEPRDMKIAISGDRSSTARNSSYLNDTSNRPPPLTPPPFGRRGMDGQSYAGGFETNSAPPPYHDGVTWTTVAVGQFDWKFEGCPHVGGGLDLQASDAGNNILATVWTGHPDHSGAYVLTSTNGGLAWSEPHQLRTKTDTGKNTDAAFLTAMDAAVVWDQRSEDEQAVYIATTSDGGTSWSQPRKLSAPDRKAEYPRIIAERTGFLVLWSEREEKQTSRVEFARIPATRGND